MALDLCPMPHTRGRNPGETYRVNGFPTVAVGGELVTDFTWCAPTVAGTNLCYQCTRKLRFLIDDTRAVVRDLLSGPVTDRPPAWQGEILAHKIAFGPSEPVDVDALDALDAEIGCLVRWAHLARVPVPNPPRRYAYDRVPLINELADAMLAAYPSIVRQPWVPEFFYDLNSVRCRHIATWRALVSGRLDLDLCRMELFAAQTGRTIIRRDIA